MKKFIVMLLAMTCLFSLAGCNKNSMNYIIQNRPSVTGVVEKVHDDYVIMYSETAEGYPNGSRWHISLNAENKDSYTEPVVGDEIVMYYDGMAMETDPLQVSTVYAITLKTPADQMNSKVHEWGIILEAEKVTPSGLTILCHQSGGDDVGELTTGSYYVIQKMEEEGWVDVEYLPHEYDIGWTMEAWMIKKEDTTRWEINWEWLYGELPAGEYRIGKQVSNGRYGQYEDEMAYAEFVIEE